MYKVISVLCFAVLQLIAINTSAQTSHYIKPFFGVGTSKINYTTNNPAYKNIQQNYMPTSSFTVGLNAGVEKKNFRFEVGLRYLGSGREFDGTFSQPFLRDSVNVKVTYNQLLVSVSGGYAIRLGNKLSIIPQVGVMPGVTANIKSKRVSYLTDSKVVSTTSPSESTQDRWFVLWGNAALDIEYLINDRFAVTLGPAYSHMLLSAAQPSTPGSAYYYKEYHTVLNGNIGVRIGF